MDHQYKSSLYDTDLDFLPMTNNDDKGLCQPHRWVIMRREIQVRRPYDIRYLTPGACLMPPSVFIKCVCVVVSVLPRCIPFFACLVWTSIPCLGLGVRRKVNGAGLRVYLQNAGRGNI